MLLEVPSFYIELAAEYPPARSEGLLFVILLYQLSRHVDLPFHCITAERCLAGGVEEHHTGDLETDYDALEYLLFVVDLVVEVHLEVPVHVDTEDIEEAGTVEVDTAALGIAKVDFVRADTAEVDIVEVGNVEVDTAMAEIVPVDCPRVDSVEPGSVGTRIAEDRPVEDEALLVLGGSPHRPVEAGEVQVGLVVGLEM